MSLIMKNGEAYGKGGGGDVYSTEERVVGTWLDGKKVYERTQEFNGTYEQNSTTNLVDGSSSNIEIVSIPIAKAVGQTGNVYTLPFVENGAGNIAVGLSVYSENNIIKYCNRGWGTQKKVLITYRYTKTTD